MTYESSPQKEDWHSIHIITVHRMSLDCAPQSDINVSLGAFVKSVRIVWKCIIRMPNIVVRRHPLVLEYIFYQGSDLPVYRTQLTRAVAGVLLYFSVFMMLTVLYTLVKHYA